MCLLPWKTNMSETHSPGAYWEPGAGRLEPCGPLATAGPRMKKIFLDMVIMSNACKQGYLHVYMF